jgi:hypothetical protein
MASRYSKRPLDDGRYSTSTKRPGRPEDLRNHGIQVAVPSLLIA